MSPQPVYVIAEAGVNHNGDFELACRLVDVAAEAGADAVKFQTFSAKRLAARSAPKAHYQQRTTGAEESQFEMLRKLELPLEWHVPLQQRARAKGIEFLSTAFDPESLAFLESLELPLLKVPSGEITNGPLLWRFARTGRPLVVSTGMATLGEVEQALAVIAHAMSHDKEPASMDEAWLAWTDAAGRDRLKNHVTLLHCTSQYPTPMVEVNLRAMDTLADAFGLAVGYSDHTEGTLIPVAAVARGARHIEKHFTLDRQLPGPDHKASLEPAELARMVADIRSIAAALGDGRKVPQASEMDTRLAARQQVVATQPVARGETVRREHLGTARCGGGLPPSELWSLVGTVSSHDQAAGEPWRR